MANTSITLTNTTETAAVAAPGAGYSLVIHSVSASNSSGTLTNIEIRSSTGGTVIIEHSLAASGGGFVEKYGDVKNDGSIPEGIRLGDNAALTAQLSGSVTSVFVNVCYSIVRN